MIGESKWSYVKAKVKQLWYLQRCLTHDSVYVHLGGCNADKETATDMLYGNKYHTWSIEQLCLAAMGRSLPEKDTIHKQIHVPDTTGME
jgi:hypothetical protein